MWVKDAGKRKPWKNEGQQILLEYCNDCVYLYTLSIGGTGAVSDGMPENDR